MAARRGPFKVSLEHRGAVTLREPNYIRSGGEADIYRTGDTVVKIYSDPAKMRRDAMPDKIRALVTALGPKPPFGIVGPQGVVSDANGEPIGFYMPWCDGEAMSRVFVTDYRARTGFNDKNAVELARDMRDLVRYAHDCALTMVDANELNWLVDFAAGAPPQARVIDVDSWAFGRWPATVVMPSIRDWHTKGFTAASDWFGWGVVSFQVFTGIHPFKGRIDGYRPGDLVERMRDNASVFDPRARLPHAVRDFSVIPGPLLDWYQATFQRGARDVPPDPGARAAPPGRAAVTRHAVTTATGALIFEKLFQRAGEDVTRVWPNGAAVTASRQIIDLETGKDIFLHAREATDVEVVRVEHGWLIAERLSLVTRLVYVDVAGHKTIINLEMNVRRFFRAGRRRLFAITDTELVELNLVLLGTPMVTAGHRRTINANATTWLDDVAVQDVMGSAFVLFPFAGNAVAQVRCPELDGATVVTGKASAGARFAAFVTLDKTGVYRKLELSFDKTFTSYQAWQGGADSADLNMGILPRGVVATVVTDGELAIFVPSSGTVKKVADRAVTTALRLAAWRDKIVYIDDGAVWQMRMS